MSDQNSIESVKAAISVVIDDGDFIINSTGLIGKAMAQAILPLAASARKVTIISDGEMRVMKRNGAVKPNGKALRTAEEQAEVMKPNPSSTGPDIQDQFVGQLERGETGEIAMGEKPVPTPGPSEPVKIPIKRKPVIFQDAAAPPAPELVEEEMDRLMAEAAKAEQDAAAIQEQQRFQRQQAVQAAVEPSDVAAAEPAEAARPRRRERQLATTGRPCGRCGGGGQIQGEAGFQGACPVCHGEGQVKTWDRALKVR